MKTLSLVTNDDRDEWKQRAEAAERELRKDKWQHIPCSLAGYAPSHRELVKRAGAWLRNRKNCGVVMEELATQNNETPDALGFYGAGSALIAWGDCNVDALEHAVQECEVEGKLIYLGV